MLRLRPYNKNDAEIIMSWIKGENAFYKWTAYFFHIPAHVFSNQQLQSQTVIPHKIHSVFSW